jgi:hypothetical protein
LSPRLDETGTHIDRIPPNVSFKRDGRTSEVDRLFGFDAVAAQAQNRASRLTP